MKDIRTEIKNILLRLKGFSTLSFAFFLGTAISAVFLIYMAPIIGTEDYGKLSYFFAIANIAFGIFFLGSGETILVYIPKGVKILSSISFLTLIFGLATSIIIYIIFYDVTVSLLVFTMGIFGLASSDLIAKKLYFSYLKYLIVTKVLFVILGISLYFLIGVSGIILGLALSFLPGLIRVFLGFKESKIEISMITSRLSFILNNYFSSLSRLVYSYADRLIIFPLFGFAFLGNYELGIQILTLTFVFPIIVYRYVLPRDAVRESTQKIKILAIIVSIGFTIITIFFAPIILPLYVPQFSDTVELIQIMGLAIVPHTLTLMYVSKFLGTEKARIVLFGAIIHLLTQIPAIIILGNLYSGLGVAIALVLAETLEVIYFFNMHRIIFKKNI